MYKKVTSIVISVHLLFMAFLLFNPQKTPVKRIAHIKVRTVRPVQPIKSNTSITKAPPPAAKQAPSTKPTTPTASKKTPAKSPPKSQTAAKKPSTSNKPAVIEKNKPIKKATPKKAEPQAEIWNEIDQALAKIEKKSYPNPQQSINLPQPLNFLDETSSNQEGEGDDQAISHLMGFLHDTLHLPEVGEVKVAITVRKDGTISKVVVLRAESRKNKLYLEEHLPQLLLPMNFDGEKTWTLTFCNEI